MTHWRLMSMMVMGILLGVSGCQPQSRLAPCQREQDCSDEEACLLNRCVAVECKSSTDCQQGEECQNYQCEMVVICQDDDDCLPPTNKCDKGTGRCVACLPQCQGKCCGPDGCNGTCADRCAATGQSCNQESCLCQGECIPDCNGKVCGPNGCKGNCPPGCSGNAYCTDAGQCQCVPQCQNRVCGPDGCNGNCLPGCNENENEKCTAEGTCQACEKQCGARVCGPDPICGLSCGPCLDDLSCNLEGVCGPWCQIGQTRCSQDGFGFQACGPDPQQPDTNTFGAKIPCQLGDTCSADSRQCVRNRCLETEIMFLLDRSSSMQNGGTWTWVKQVLLQKISERDAPNRFGFREFPSGSGCQTGEVLPMRTHNAAAIAAAVTDPTADSATPIEKALQGLVTLYGDANDGQAIVILSDGDENCTQPPELGIAAAGSLWRFGIKVHVLAVTTMANKSFLDRLALAGGTVESRLVTTSVELEQALALIYQDLNACLCEPGQTTCSADQAKICSADQRSFDFVENCPLGCASDGQGCRLCDTDSLLCQGDQLLRCSADRKRYESWLACPAGCIDQQICRGVSVLIPAGSVIMGSDAGVGEADEEPKHSVTLDPFYLDVFETTNTEYAECVAASVCTEPISQSSHSQSQYYGNSSFARYPVLSVSWGQAARYCQWRGKRLPTEAEWERAARGQSPLENIFPWGTSDAGCLDANFSNCLGDTTVVGSYRRGASSEGIYDLAGNVYEWVQDWYGASYYATSLASNPLGPTADEGMGRSIRGGGYASAATYIRAANRAARDPGSPVDNLGIRCAQSPPDVDHDGDGFTPGQGDCDDGDPAVHPDAAEACSDLVDNNCDGSTDEGCPTHVVQFSNANAMYIPDQGCVDSQINVDQTITPLTVSASVQITHTYVGDLEISVVHPNGTSVLVRDNQGGSASVIDESYEVPSLANLPAAGSWSLHVCDTSQQDTGQIDSWSLTLGY